MQCETVLHETGEGNEVPCVDLSELESSEVSAPRSVLVASFSDATVKVCSIPFDGQAV
jgi:hypothetical protein